MDNLIQKKTSRYDEDYHINFIHKMREQVVDEDRKLFAAKNVKSEPAATKVSVVRSENKRRITLNSAKRDKNETVSL